MSFAPAAVDKAMVVVELDPRTLLAAEGKFNVLLPVASWVTTKVPYEPAIGVDKKVKFLFPAKVTLAFNPSTGFQTTVDPSVKACGVDAYIGVVILAAVNPPLVFTFVTFAFPN